MHPVGDGFAELALVPHHIGDRGVQLRLERRFVGRLAGGAGAVGFDQRVGPRQAADMTGQNPVATGLHRSLPDHRLARSYHPAK
jgi:hypothetical protein